MCLRADPKRIILELSASADFLEDIRFKADAVCPWIEVSESVYVCRSIKRRSKDEGVVAFTTDEPVVTLSA